MSSIIRITTAREPTARDTPRASRRHRDTPERRDANAILPEPRDAIAILPEPRDAIAILPEPRDAIAILPEPRDAIAILPERRDAIAILPGSMGARGTGGLPGVCQTTMSDFHSYVVVGILACTTNQDIRRFPRPCVVLRGANQHMCRPDGSCWFGVGGATLGLLIVCGPRLSWWCALAWAPTVLPTTLSARRFIM